MWRGRQQVVKAGHGLFLHGGKVFVPAEVREFVEDMGIGRVGQQVLAHGQHDMAVHSGDAIEPHLAQHRLAAVGQQRQGHMSGAQTAGDQLDRGGKSGCGKRRRRVGQVVAIPVVR